VQVSSPISTLSVCSIELYSSNALILIVFSEDNDDAEARDGFDVLDLDDGQHVEIQTSVLEEKSAAFDALLGHAATLGAKFGPYIRPTLELALPNLKVIQYALF
jgi:hypothetical protein